MIECDKNKPFYLGFTSLGLLKRLQNFNNQGTFHLDATYKIVKYNYPLIVFGFTDLFRKFYPVAFMFVSREQQADFEHFFNSLLSVMDKFKLKLQPKFIVIDAHYPSANAIAKIFPDTVILMCWFHLKQNLRKHRHLMAPDNYANTLKQCNDLHNCTNISEFNVTYFKNF